MANPRNMITLNGRIVKDPTFSKRKDGTEFSTGFIMAVQRNIPNKAGEYTSDFIPIRYEGEKRMGFAHKLNKGDTILVSGSFRSDNYEANGKNCYTQFVFADQIEFDNETRKKKYSKQNIEDSEENEEDLPF